VRERTKSGVLPLILVAAPALVAAQVPAGGEFQVNSYTTADQFAPAASMGDSGNLILVWQSTQDGSNIMGQRFDTAGLRMGAEFQVNTYTGPFNASPDVA